MTDCDHEMSSSFVAAVKITGHA